MVAAGRTQPDSSSRQASPSPSYFIDAVCCSHEFTDHCHEATLRELPTTVPVFAPKKAASLVRSWNHFEHVEDVPVYRSAYDWRAVAERSRLPRWLGIGRVHTRGDAPIYFHSALVITFALAAAGGDRRAEAIVYTPHGVAADSLSLLVAQPGKHPAEILALIHGLHDISLAGAQLNLGMRNAVRAREILGARYWVPTHDEQKVARGLVASFLKRVVHTLPVAPGSHPITGKDEGESDRRKFGLVEKSFVEVENGESFVLA